LHVSPEHPEEVGAGETKREVWEVVIFGRSVEEM
jgi:hypothetical protein